MKNRIFFFPLETSSRDYPYKKRLSDAIYKNGDIHIFARPWVLSYLCLFVRDVNWIGQNVNHKFRFSGKKLSQYIKSKNGKIFYFDEEGGFYYPSELAHEVIRHRYESLSIEDIDYVFSWGICQHTIVSEMGFNSVCLGHPRFDPIQRSKLDKNKDNILLLTNFSLILSKKTFQSEFDDKYFPARRTSTLEDISQLFKFVSENDDKVIQIRVHPSEDLDLYKIMFKSLKNVKILDRESLSDSFSRSDTLYHFNCTSALDAFARGMKTYNLSKGSSTIISDLPEHKERSFKSKWLNYPSEFEEISSIISSKSMISKNKCVNLKLSILLRLLEYLYGLRRFYVGSYETQKFGDLESLCGHKSYVIVKK